MSRSKEAWAHYPSAPISRGGTGSLALPVGLFEAGVERFVLFDTETTGLEADARVVEIAAAWVDVRTGMVVETRSKLVNPGMKIPPRATAIHGIRDRDVADAPRIGRLLTSYFAFLDEGPALAHNAGFDVRRLRFEAERTGVRLPGRIPIHCTTKLAKKALPGLKSYSLENLVTGLGIARKGRAHRAESDVIAAAELVMHCLRTSQKDLRELAPAEDML